MARDPGSVWSPLPEAGVPDGYRKIKYVVHSTGTRASAAANARYFAQAGVVVESTFVVGLTSADPTVQLMDSTDRADANGSANNDAISVEVVGLAGDPYTPWQESELIRLGVWSLDEHPIPEQIIPEPGAGGVGWHVMFGAPGPWTSVRGKECPGGGRIARLRSTIFPAIFARAGAPAPAPGPRFAHPIAGSILAAFTRAGGLDVLGQPRGPEVATGTGGRWQEFVNGSAWWHPRFGGPAWTVSGAIGREFAKLGREALFGWPLTDERTCGTDNAGRYNHFDGGRSIYWHPLTGAVPVFGGIRDTWAGTGWERGPLGYPTGPEQPGAGGIVQPFQRGSILWSAGRGLVRADG